MDCDKNAQCLVEHKDGTFCGDFVKLKQTKNEGFFEMSNALSYFKSKAKHLGSWEVRRTKRPMKKCSRRRERSWRQSR